MHCPGCVMDGALFAYSREPHVLAGDLIVSPVTFIQSIAIHSYSGNSCASTLLNLELMLLHVLVKAVDWRFESTLLMAEAFTDHSAQHHLWLSSVCLCCFHLLNGPNDSWIFSSAFCCLSQTSGQPWIGAKRCLEMMFSSQSPFISLYLCVAVIHSVDWNIVVWQQHYHLLPFGPKVRTLK